MKRAFIFVFLGFTTATLISFLSSCGTKAPHSGFFPFSTMEKPVSQCVVKHRTRSDGQTPQQMTEVVRYHAHNSPNEKTFQHAVDQIQIGDVIAFYMSHEEARQHLRHGALQKIPYELFRYGHLSLVVPNPKKNITYQTRSDLRLLQVAMRQAITASDGLEYLTNKSWVILRPPTGSINQEYLHTFTQEIVKKGSSSKKSYRYTAAIGLWNGNIHPMKKSEIDDQYTCTTLIVAALNYSGYQLYSARRYGVLDLITPHQVITSWGVKNR